jgi:hypothetical protein
MVGHHMGLLGAITTVAKGFGRGKRS